MTNVTTYSAPDLQHVLEGNDPVAEALHALRMTGTFYCHSVLTAPFSVGIPEIADCLMFHAVTEGSCRLRSPTGEEYSLERGDLAVLPYSRGHVLFSGSSEKPVDLFEIPRELLSERFEILRYGGGGDPVRMICAAACFDHPAAHRVLDMLPGVLIVRGTGQRMRSDIENVLSLMANEARYLQPGGETVITRLADIVIIQAIRAWIAESGAANSGWLGALKDTRIGRALQVIHREPHRQWSVETLARSAGMSRSGFSARFTELVGEPPLQYVTRWRMELARSWLKRSDRSIAEVAESLGYGSEAAFTRAFRRVSGETPGRFRRVQAPSGYQP